MPFSVFPDANVRVMLQNTERERFGMRTPGDYSLTQIMWRKKMLVFSSPSHRNLPICVGYKAQPHPTMDEKENN